MLLDINEDPMDILLALRSAQACTVESTRVWAEKLAHMELLQKVVEAVEKQIERGLS